VRSRSEFFHTAPQTCYFVPLRAPVASTAVVLLALTFLDEPRINCPWIQKPPPDKEATPGQVGNFQWPRLTDYAPADNLWIFAGEAAERRINSGRPNHAE
jgi:hypothetical protein